MQAGLRLCCSQTPVDKFSGVEAHIKIVWLGAAIYDLVQQCSDCILLCYAAYIILISRLKYE